MSSPTPRRDRFLKDKYFFKRPTDLNCRPPNSPPGEVFEDRTERRGDLISGSGKPQNEESDSVKELDGKYVCCPVPLPPPPLRCGQKRAIYATSICGGSPQLDETEATCDQSPRCLCLSDKPANNLLCKLLPASCQASSQPKTLTIQANRSMSTHRDKS
ncbi:hypothetical protein Mapa_016468 [Marchantia paleacea]|nr:hypothetical protein Mapa_016468 [Marchantia paleacea]